MTKYNSVNNIPAKIFFDILHNQDYNLLEPINEDSDIEQIFSDIYDDYFVRSDNEKSKEFLELRQNIAFMTYKIESVVQVLSFLSFNKTTSEMRDTLLEALISIGINVNLENEFEQEVETILQVELGIIQNDVNLAVMELDAAKAQNEDVVFNFYESLIALETAHERNLDDEMVLAKFIEYEKIAIKKAAAQKQKNAKFNNK